MNSFHTNSLVDADIFMVMGSVYAEVARYDAALDANQKNTAMQAVARAKEILEFSKKLKQLNSAQKMEIQQFFDVFLQRVNEQKQSKLDSYLLPFAVGARMRQFNE